mmetsp:Transcript_21324/g.54274  ORF Transcript_21324/g.54274 Transcript_21324/m.54274 type:complete len:204 (-) Transcript_21324:5-616(-)
MCTVGDGEPQSTGMSDTAGMATAGAARVAWPRREGAAAAALPAPDVRPSGALMSEPSPSVSWSMRAGMGRGASTRGEPCSLCLAGESGAMEAVLGRGGEADAAEDTTSATLATACSNACTLAATDSGEKGGRVAAAAKPEVIGADCAAAGGATGMPEAGVAAAAEGTAGYPMATTACAGPTGVLTGVGMTLDPAACTCGYAAV